MTDLRQAAQQAIDALLLPTMKTQQMLIQRDEAIIALRRALEQPEQEPKKLWLWKNFVDGKPEYWAFDNAFPVHLECDDPQTLGEPCGYAIFKPSREGRTDISDGEVLLRIKKVAAQRPWQGLDNYKDWDEIDSKRGTTLDTFADGAAWAGAKLKERNT